LITRLCNVQCFQMFFMFYIHQSHDFVYSQFGCLNLWKQTSIENYWYDHFPFPFESCLIFVNVSLIS
jgi:hypothetical protein